MTHTKTEIYAVNSDKLRKYLKANNVGTLDNGRKSLNNFKKLKMGKVDNKSNKIFKDLVMLPMNISVTQSEVMHISNLIKRFYG